MKDYINDFDKHLSDAIKIGDCANLILSNKRFSEVLICGLGGSGIGGTIVSDIISATSSVPIITSKGYSVPNFVNKNTLVIACSYSGNTEETISSLQKCYEKKAEIAIITSGGILKEFAKSNRLNKIVLPSGNPPRAMIGYSLTGLFYILSHYNIIDSSFRTNLQSAITLLKEEKSHIKNQAKKIAKKLHNSTPVIYVADGFEGVAVRFRQQINENSKMLCWHHVIPEMNHNELLGWRINTKNLSVIYFRNDLDHDRNKIRIDINKTIISDYTKNITDVWSKGNTLIENSLYHINFGDWISWYLSEMNEVDAIEIDIINYLKTELGKL